MSKSIEMIVSPEGEITIEALGFKGQGCAKATEALEQALGTVKQRKRKPEWTAKEQLNQSVG